MLEVGIDDDHGPAARMVEPGGDGDLLAEVAREGRGADDRLLPRQRADARQGVVAAAVVDERNLPRCDAGGQHRPQPFNQKLDAAPR